MLDTTSSNYSSNPLYPHDSHLEPMGARMHVAPRGNTDPWVDVRTVYPPQLVEIRPVLGGPAKIGCLFSWARRQHGDESRWYGYVVHSDGKAAEHVESLFLKPYEPQIAK